MSGFKQSIKKHDPASCGDPGATRDHALDSGDEEPRIHFAVRRRSLTSMKEPWVPAPGRTTRAQIPHQSGPTDHHTFQDKRCTSSPEMPATARSSHSSLVGRPSNKVSKPKRGRAKQRDLRDRSMSGYALKTKDSLVDITASLEAKREEILQVWQQNLPHSNSTLLALLEQSNFLALDTMKDVTKLGSAIKALHAKAEKPSTEDMARLDEIRSQIFSKLEEFGVAHAQIQLNLRKSRENSVQRRSRGSQVSLPSAEKKYESTTPAGLHAGLPAKTSSSLIYLKERSDRFSGPETENEMDSEPDTNYSNDPLHERELDSASDATQPDLSKLNKLYSEKFEFPKLPKRSPAEHVQVSASEEEPLSNLKRNEARSAHGNTDLFDASKNYDNFDSSSYYRDKIHELYKKLLEQESKYEEMNREIQRIDSEKGFEMKLLKSNIKNQLDDLAPLPELVEMSEKRLNDVILAKFAIESSLQRKTEELKGLKKEIARIAKDLQEAQLKLSQSEVKREGDMKKIDSLEQENKSLRTELSARSETLIKLEQRFGGQAVESIVSPDGNRRNMVLEDKILELETALAKQRKKTSILKEAKNNLSKRMTLREEELMGHLEESRARNRTLQTHMQLVKNSYYELYSPIYGGDLIFPESMRAINEQLPKTPERKEPDERNV